MATEATSTRADLDEWLLHQDNSRDSAQSYPGHGCENKAMTTPQVELRRVFKHYGAVTAVEDISLTIARGEFVVLLGPSGSGKTTILSMMGGFTEPTSGDIFIEGKRVTHLPPAKRPSATVFQDYALFPHLNVINNVNFGLWMHKIPKAQRKRRIDEVLSIVGLADMGKRSVHQLSGGQRQRVALARAIAVEPSVLLLDEPLGALDLKIRRQMQEELTAIQRKIGTTFVHVTHDQDEAMSMADTIVVVNQGRIEEMGSPRQIYTRPANRFVANFMGESNLIPARVIDQSNDTVRIESAMGEHLVKGDDTYGPVVTLCIRPENLKLYADEEGTVSLGVATVSEVVFHGSHLRLRVRGGPDRDVDLVLQAPPDTSVELGSTVELGAISNDLTLLRD